MNFKAGDLVGIRCDVRPGPFDGERVITVTTIEGSISGFVRETELRESNGSWEVRGEVQEAKGAVLKVMIFGSFFTTNGLANIPTDLAMAA